jgi:anti-sigma regulatory factor (Ser/Thr protein kinase)
MKKYIAPDTIRITIPSNPKYLRALRALIEEVTYEMEFHQKARNDIIHAVNEACTNVIKHSYDNDFEKEIIIYLTNKLDHIEVVIKDFGKKARPGRIRHRKLHDIKPGGLGVYFIKQSMDGIWYDTTPRVGTELRMIKYLKKKNA